MRIRPAAAAVLIGVCLQFSALLTVHANSSPPPPPPTPTCGPCGGPPQPPTPVPTAASTVAPRPLVVSVHLAPSRVRRGHREKVTVKDGAVAAVTMVLHYHRGHAVTFRGKIGSSGSYSRAWTVPESAPTGKATIKVTVKGDSSSYTDTESFVVTG